MLQSDAHPLAGKQGSSFQATQQEGERGEEGRDTESCPQDTRVTLLQPLMPKAAFWGAHSIWQSWV